MGHIGKLSRGMKWWKYNRDRDGTLEKYISEDYDKMLDVNYFLDYCKGKYQEKVELALMKYFLLNHAIGGKKSKLYRDLKKRIDDGDFKKEDSKKTEKK